MMRRMMLRSTQGALPNIYENSIFHADYEELLFNFKDSVNYENIFLEGVNWQRGVLGKIKNTVNLPLGSDNTHRLKNINFTQLNGATHFNFRTWFRTTATGFRAICYLNNFGIRIVNGRINFLTGASDQTTMQGLFNDGNWHRLVLNFPQSGLTSDFEVYVDNVKLDFQTDPAQVIPISSSYNNINLYISRQNAQQFAGELDSTTLDKDVNFSIEQVAQDWNEGNGVPYIDTTMQGTYDIWLVAGQSNAVGYAQFDNPNTLPALQNGVNNGGYSFNNSFIVKDYKLSDTGFFGDGSNYTKTFPDLPEREGYSFNDVAINLLAPLKTNKQIICKAAVGGTTLYNNEDNATWNVDYANILPENRLTQLLNEKFDRLINYLTINQISYNIKGILWHQGETDIIYPNGPSEYAVNFANFVQEVRNFTGINNLPIIYGTVSVNSAAYNLTIRNAHLDFANNDANAYCRDNNDLTLYDNVHFDQVSTNTFGEWAKDIIINNL